MKTSWDIKAERSIKRADARAARLGRLIDAQYNLARRMEVAATFYADSGQFIVIDTLRHAARQARETIGILERARDLASARSWTTHSDGSVVVRERK